MSRKAASTDDLEPYNHSALRCLCGGVVTARKNDRLWWVECGREACCDGNPTTALKPTARGAIGAWRRREFLR